MRIAAAFAAGLSAFLHQFVGDIERDEREHARRKKFGTCGWCGEIMCQPIHDADCPARLEDERDLMRGEL